MQQVLVDELEAAALWRKHVLSKSVSMAQLVEQETLIHDNRLVLDDGLRELLDYGFLA